MKVRNEFRRDDVLAFLDELFGQDLHAKRVLSLANATLGVMTGGSLAVHLIGQALAQARGTLTKHGVKQVDRLLSNRGIDVWALFEHWVAQVVGARKEILVAMDWTEFDHDGHSTIMLSLVTEHGRTTPLVWLTVSKATLKGQRAEYENRVLRRLREVLPEGVKVTILADRGFGDQGLYALLDEELEFGYVIRFRSDILVTDAKGETRPASAWVGSNGRARTLRKAAVTANRYEVGTVVCVQDKDMKDLWCLVASDEQAPTRQIINYYSRRWGIEPSFRDTKDLRFGMGMKAVRLKDTGRRDRLYLLNAFAVVLLSLLGAAGEALGYDRHLKANTVKRRTHSLFRQGCMHYELMPNMPEQRLRPLMEKFAELLCQHRTFSDVLCVV